MTFRQLHLEQRQRRRPRRPQEAVNCQQQQQHEAVELLQLHQEKEQPSSASLSVSLLGRENISRTMVSSGSSSSSSSLYSSFNFVRNWRRFVLVVLVVFAVTATTASAASAKEQQQYQSEQPQHHHQRQQEDGDDDPQQFPFEEVRQAQKWMEKQAETNAFLRAMKDKVDPHHYEQALQRAALKQTVFQGDGDDDVGAGDSGSLQERLLRAAIPVPKETKPSTKATTAAAAAKTAAAESEKEFRRKLNNNNNGNFQYNYEGNGYNYKGNNNNNGNDQYEGIDLSSYSLKYVGCQNIHTWSDDNAADEYRSSPLQMDRFVVFRLCPSTTCSDYNKWGCNSQYGEYMIPMQEYLEIVLNYHLVQMTTYCSVCTECIYEAANYVAADDAAVANDDAYNDDVADDYVGNDDGANGNAYGDDLYGNGGYNNNNNNGYNYNYNYYGNNNNGRNGNGYGNYNNNNNGGGYYNYYQNGNGYGNGNNNNGGNYNYNNNNNGNYNNGGNGAYNYNGNNGNGGNYNYGNSYQQGYNNYQNQNNNYNNYNNNNNNNGGDDLYADDVVDDGYNGRQRRHRARRANNNNDNGNGYLDEYGKCVYATVCSTYQKQCKNVDQDAYDNDSSNALQNYFYCTKFNIGNNVGYVAPHCRTDGRTIGIGFYADATCDSYIGDVADLSKYLTVDDSEFGAFYDKGCVSCNAVTSYSLVTDKALKNYAAYDDDTVEYVNGGSPVYPFCSAMYDLSAKCHLHLSGNPDYTYESEQQADNEESVCEIIESLIENTYDEFGEVILREFRLSNWNKPTEYSKLVSKVSGAQVFFLTVSILLAGALGGYAYFLQKKLHNRKPWIAPRRVGKRWCWGSGDGDAASEAGYISRMNSGIVAMRTANSVDGGSSQTGGPNNNHNALGRSRHNNNDDDDDDIVDPRIRSPTSLERGAFA